MKCRCHRRRLGCASQRRDGFGLVCREVVQDDVDVEFAGGVVVDAGEERQHIAPGVGFAGLMEHLAGGDVEGGEQVHGAAAAVVMGHGACPARFDGQRRLGTVQGLDLGFLVEAEHHRPLGGIQVQPDHIGELGLEVRIVGQLEHIGAPRPQTPRPPDPPPRCPCPTPWRAAIDRVDQHTDPSSGTAATVSPTIAATVAAAIWGLRPRPGATWPTPAAPDSKNRSRQRPHRVLVRTQLPRHRPHRLPAGQRQQRTRRPHPPIRLNSRPRPTAPAPPDPAPTTPTPGPCPHTSRPYHLSDGPLESNEGAPV